jgi:hypothetical protein
MRVSKFPKLRFSQLWGLITLCVDLQLQWGLKQSCSLHQELSNNMLHATCTQGNRLLMVGSQIANLIPPLSFGHNLCFRCPNGSCKPNLDIYASITFQQYKFFFQPMGFDPWNHLLKIRDSIGTLNSQNGSSFGSVRVHSLTLFCTLGSMKCDSRASFLACNLANPCLGREPKARVATMPLASFS